MALGQSLALQTFVPVAFEQNCIAGEVLLAREECAEGKQPAGQHPALREVAALPMAISAPGNRYGAPLDTVRLKSISAVGGPQEAMII